MAASSETVGAFSLVGRLPQWWQQVSAVTAARARDSTAVKTISPEVSAGEGRSAGSQARDHVVREEQCVGSAAPRGPEFHPG